MAGENKIYMDTNIGKEMYVHMKDKVTTFGQMRNRLCGFDPKNNNAHVPEQLKETFNKKKTNLTK